MTEPDAGQPAPARVPASLSPEQVRPQLLRAVTLLAFIGQAIAFFPVRQDDPFITYRYGQNLVLGHGFVFNPGERILGSTAPGHMLLSALVYLVFGQEHTPSWMSVLGCLGWTAQAVAAHYLLSPQLGRRLSIVVSFALLLGAARSFMWVPFETNLVAALTLWAFVAVARERFTLAAALSGLASVMRPDALLLAALLGAVCLFRLRRRALTPIAVFFALFLPWLIFATVYYGSPLPQSAITKFHRASVPDYLGHILSLVGETAVPYATGVPALVLAWVVIVAGATALARRDKTLALYVLYAVLHAVAYLFLRPFIGHDWHLYPLQLAAAIFAVGGVAQLAQQLPTRGGRSVMASALAALVLAACVRTSFLAATYRDDYWTGARHDVYLHLSGFLKAHAAPGDAFASIEVGTLAYYTGMRVYDMGGLVTDTSRVSGDPAVRWLVLDANYLWMAPPWQPVYAASNQKFKAFLFYVPAGKHLTFPRIETLPP